MDLSVHDTIHDAVHELRARVADAAAVAPVGAGTQWEVGGPPPDGERVSAPAGVLAYDPHELTVTVAAGTATGALAGVLAESGQECPLDARNPDATVGGVLAAGLSGHRRLRYGPLRDTVLEVHFVTADGRLVKGGGKTVKNVSGYDIPRLLVGSLGTIGVITEVTLRCRPIPAVTTWFASDADPFAIRAATFRPSSILWDGRRSWTLLEGHADDVDAERRRAGLPDVDAGGPPAGPPTGPPSWPTGPHRGRISVRPSQVRAVGDALARAEGTRWLAEVGVGTVHVAADEPGALARARAIAETAGGWLLREAGAPDLDGFGAPLPNATVMARIKNAFDPTGKLSPGRLPFNLAASGS